MASLERKKSGAFVVVWRVEGRKKKEYLPVGTTKEEAEVVKAAKTKLEKERKIGMHLDVGIKKKVRTFSEFLFGYTDENGEVVVGYLDWRKHAMPDSYVNIFANINRNVKYFGHLKIADDDATCDAWNNAFNNWEIERGSSIAKYSLWGEWKDIKAALYRAARTGGAKDGRRWNLSPTSPAANLVLKMTEVKKRTSASKVIFSVEELERIKAADPENGALWMFIAYTGLRRSEIEVLPTFAVDRTPKYAKVRVLHDPAIGVNVKDNESRSIPLNAEAMAARDEILAKSGDGELFAPKWHQDTWTKKFNAAREAAGIKRGTLHSLRHTFISRAANNGVSIHLVMKWAGHAKLETTLGYLHTPEGYEWLEMEKMLNEEKAKVVELRKAA